MDGDHMTLVFVAADKNNIDLAYLGSRLPNNEDLCALVQSGRFGKHENEPDIVPIGGLLPQTKNGYLGKPALTILVDGKSVGTDFSISELQCTGKAFHVTWFDRTTKLQVDCSWHIQTGDVVKTEYSCSNQSDNRVTLIDAPALVLPLPARFDCITAFPGRWAREMQATNIPIGRHAISFSSRNGKPGFDGGDRLMINSSQGTEKIMVHHSNAGDHFAHAEQDQDGRRYLLAGPCGGSGGEDIDPGQTSNAGQAVFTYGADANAVAQNLHQYLRQSILPQRKNWGPRKVHLNSWEALGFDLDEEKLKQLATDAADLGVERFVLDDGWFKGRRNDSAGLGDWVVDADIFPNGLAPIIDHVKSLDMDFGLWVEPEMVSPDSDLYRAHPDWCLHDGSDHRPTERNQLMLDLTNPDVEEYLLRTINSLLQDNDIAYLKWDHNRRTFPYSPTGSPSAVAIANSAAQLMEAVFRSNPGLEIETCSSGGGRVSYGLLKHCHRIWPSDNNDPIERLRIMDSWTRFLPLEVLGNHVGPSPNPITGRRTDMDFRSKVALFGHMGVEANPADMSAKERDILRAHLMIYKGWREVLHGGKFWRLNHEEASIFGQMVVGGPWAIAIVAQTAFSENFNVAPVRLEGLEAQKQYRISLPEPWPAKAAQYLHDPDGWREGLRLSGRVLMDQGLALPLTHPETAWIITLEEVEI